MTIIDTIMIFLAGWFLGRAYMEYQNISKLREFMRDIKDDYEEKIILIENPEKWLKENQATEATVLVLEKHGNSYYAYDNVEEEFICQGNSFQEIAEKLNEGTGNRKIPIAQLINGDEIMWAVKGKIQKEAVDDTHSN